MEFSVAIKVIVTCCKHIIMPLQIGDFNFVSSIAACNKQLSTVG